jgi:NAD(P)H dehydrogenase (quinone)
MILITGSTGELGKETMKALLQHAPADQIIAFARDPEKARSYAEQGAMIRTGDYSNQESLVKAFRGVDKVLLITAPAFSENSPEENAIRAAVEAGVRHLVYVSIQSKANSEIIIPGVTLRDIAARGALIHSGLIYTIVRNPLYTDALPFMLGTGVLENGVSFPSGDGRVPVATREDLGEATAKILLSDEYDYEDITLTNIKTWSFKDVADILSEITGKPVPFLNSNRSEYVTYMEETGLPTFVGEFAADWGDTIRSGEFEETYSSLQKILGRKPTDLKTYMAGIYKPQEDQFHIQ